MNFEIKLYTILEAYSGQELHPGLWLKSGQLEPEARGNLLKIANDFASQHRIPNDAINDITITGSMANLNWSKYSDIDVHLVVDFTDIDENDELLRDYYNLAKNVWDEKHDITVCDHEVEVYVQDEEEPHHSTGLYSITDNKWLIKPKAVDTDKPSMQQIKTKSKKYISKINSFEQSLRDKNFDSLVDNCERLGKKLKKMRKAGLEAAGEYSIENLVYKFLRNRGYIDKLNHVKISAYDRSLTIDNC